MSVYRAVVIFAFRPESNKIEMQEEGEEESDVDEQYETLQEEEIEYLKKLSQGEFLKGIDKKWVVKILYDKKVLLWHLFPKIKIVIFVADSLHCGGILHKKFNV